MTVSVTSKMIFDRVNSLDTKMLLPSEADALSDFKVRDMFIVYAVNEEVDHVNAIDVLVNTLENEALNEKTCAAINSLVAFLAYASTDESSPPSFFQKKVIAFACRTAKKYSPNYKFAELLEVSVSLSIPFGEIKKSFANLTPNHYDTYSK